LAPLQEKAASRLANTGAPMPATGYHSSRQDSSEQGERISQMPMVWKRPLCISA